MKKYFFLAVLLSSIAVVNAQDFQGVAEYESKIKLDLTAHEGDGPQLELGDEMQEAINRAMEKSYTLRFDKAASIFEEKEKLDKPTAGGGMMIEVNFAGSGKLYKNLKDKTYSEEADIFDKQFLVVDKLQQWDWKIGTETKKIGNYTCYKATAVLPKKDMKLPEADHIKKVNIMDSNIKDDVITAWYAPEIPVSHGPANYWGLPGLILEVNDGHMVYLCSKLTLNPKEKTEIKPLKKGTRVTQAEYNKILEEKTGEMMQDSGPNDSDMIIKIGG